MLTVLFLDKIISLLAFSYYSCALVADILLQGHLYVSENYFSFYSNVFGYVTKLVIPISTVEKITKEKTAKFFPNAIALQLNEAQKPHVFGSFLSREAAYQLMSSIHRKNEVNVEPAEEIEEAEIDEVDGAQGQDVSSLDDSSSISGSESPILYKVPAASVSEIIEEEPPPAQSTPRRLHTESFVPTTSGYQPIAKVGSYNVKLMSEFNLLFVGIVLTILLAFFSGLLLFKINAIEQRDKQMDLHFTSDSGKFTIDDAESILNRNVLIVRNVRKKLEDLQEMLQGTFEKIQPLGEKHEL